MSSIGAHETTKLFHELIWWWALIGAVPHTWNGRDFPLYLLTQRESAERLYRRKMDWQAAMTAAKDWAAQSSLGFSVGTVVENERKISFKAPWGSFYVTIPEKIGSEEWVTSVKTSLYYIIIILQLSFNRFFAIALLKYIA